MSRRDATKRSPNAVRSSLETTKGSERTPLLNSAGMSESLVNKNVSEMQAGVSWGVAAFLLVNTALGAGMLNYPFAYNQIGGILAATLTQAVLLIFITSTMFILVYCADFNRDDTYHDVLLSMCGRRAQQVSAISILLTCFGINVTFLVIIGDQYDRVFNSLLAEYVDQFWFLDRKFTISMTATLFIWPMCYARRLDFLRHASILGMFAMLYVAFLTIYEHYQLDTAALAVGSSSVGQPAQPAASSNVTSTSLSTKPIRWFESLAIVPVLCFAYQTHEVIIPVYACMKQRSIGHFMKASIFGLFILFIIYNLVGAYGYLTFGKNVGPDIMSLYNAKDPIVVIGVVALVVKFITTYPPLMFCGRGALDGLYGEFRHLSTEEFKSSEKMRRLVITTIWFFTTVALAVFAPDISLTLQLLGSMASINVFVFPGMCLVSLTRRLRQARLAWLTDEANDQANNPQRAKDYYLISGSYFGALKKNASRGEGSVQNQSNQLHSNARNTNDRQHFTATFASLMEYENNTSSRFGEQSTNNLNGNGTRLNGYGTSQSRHQKRQEEFDKLLTTASVSAQDQCGLIGRINDSYDDYSDCENRKNQKCDLISSLVLTNNGHANNNSYCRKGIDSDFYNSSNNKDLSLDQNRRQCLQSSWNNRSTTGSLLDRLGESIAPSTVAQSSPMYLGYYDERQIEDTSNQRRSSLPDFEPDERLERSDITTTTL